MAAVSSDLEFHIRQNTHWSNLPSSLKESLGKKRHNYDQEVLEYSIKNQLVWRTNLVRNLFKNEKKYYEEVLQTSRNYLMLYPYHLQDQFVQGLKVTPFDYYHSMLQVIMIDQKSYDSLPNFTARDCLRLTGIGRNQYIDTMNKYRSKRFWKKRAPSEFIPSQPPEDIVILPWWLINVGYATEEEVENCSPEEREIIDNVIKEGPQLAGSIDEGVVRSLYLKKLLYIVIPVYEDDMIVVPPLKGFVMNRVQGDYFESLLYKVFVTINEHLTITELTSVLQIPLQEVKNAVSVFIRLGFAHKKVLPDPSAYHASWATASIKASVSNIEGTGLEQSGMQGDDKQLVMEDFMLVDFCSDVNEGSNKTGNEQHKDNEEHLMDVPTGGTGFQKRIGFVFDSTLTAFLMMGNLSPSLKNHAVTMFEVGKLTDEAMDSFMAELDKVGEEPEGEGEAQRYFHHAVTLRNTVQFLRNNSQLIVSDKEGVLGLDLLHCESITKLDKGTLSRLLQKNYSILISMAPLSQEVHSITSCTPPHIGPVIPEMNSIWFKLWLYHKLKCGPPSLLLIRGTRLTTLPRIFKRYEKLLLTSWGHDQAVIQTSNVLISLNEALTHSSVLIQAYSWHSEGKLEYVTFPFERKGVAPEDIVNHPALKQLEQLTDLKHTCGYVTMMYTGAPPPHIYNTSKPRTHHTDQGLVAQKEEISEFLEDLKELGIGGGTEDTPTRIDATPTPADNKDSNDEVSPSIQRLSEQWVPLELCYGLPLFNDEANGVISQKIVSHQLFSAQSLQNLTQSYRLLTMELLDFISKFQSGGSDVYSHRSQRTDDDPTVPLPSVSLMFNNGVLEPF